MGEEKRKWKRAIPMDEVKHQIERLKSGNEKTYRDAAEELVEIGGPAVPALIKELNNNSDFYDYRQRHIRRVTIVVLSKIGASAAVAIPTLIEVLRNSDPDSRREATGALSNIGIPAVPTLTQEIMNSYPHCREEFVEALKKMGIPAIPGLIEMLKSDTTYSRYIHSTATKLLMHIATRQPTPHLRGAIPVLKRLKRDRWEEPFWPQYQQLLETIEKATAGLKDIPIVAATTRADDLPVPIEEAPTTAPAPTTRKGLLQRVFRR